MVAMLMHHNHSHGGVPPNSAAAGAGVSHGQPSPSPSLREGPDKVRLFDILPYDGAPTEVYMRAVDALSASLMRHNAAVIELGSDDAALFRCALESARLYFRTRKGGGRSFTYRAGRPLEDVDSSPPCMADIFRCMARAARAALCAIARYLRLRSDCFNHLLDDNPLPANEASSSVLVATFNAVSLLPVMSTPVAGRPVSSCEVEKGLLMLISSDSPGIQVCDPNGRWYQADSCLAPGELLVVTGKALSHATAGLRPTASYRPTPDNFLIPARGGRTSLIFRLMPQGNAILDCTPIAAAGHVIPQSYVPVSVNQFMDALSAENDVLCNHADNTYVPAGNPTSEPSLRSVLSDPLSGAFLEDAMLVSCGHSFGGLLLRKVVETAKCVICNSEIETGSLIPNHGNLSGHQAVFPFPNLHGHFLFPNDHNYTDPCRQFDQDVVSSLRAAALAVKQEDDRRLFHNATLRKRRKEASEHRENGETNPENDSSKGVQYPFLINEKVMIKGNRRTPDKFVGKEAVITTQCLNGWYLLKIVESGENVRLQYRSLRKIPTSDDSVEMCISQPVQHSS